MVSTAILPRHSLYSTSTPPRRIRRPLSRRLNSPFRFSAINNATAIAVAAAAALTLLTFSSLVLHSVLEREAVLARGGLGDGLRLNPPGSDPGGDFGGVGGLIDGGETDDDRDHYRKTKKGAKGRKPRLDDGVNLDDMYARVRAEHDRSFPPDDADRLIEYAQSLRLNSYDPIAADSMPYDVTDCPDYPPEGYPLSWPVLDVINNWNPDDAVPRSKIYQGICRFDATTEYEKAVTYRRAEVPFVIRDDPAVLPTVERWNRSPEYLSDILGRTSAYRADYSDTNHLMFFRTQKGDETPEGWQEPTSQVKITFPDWLEKARDADATELPPDRPHWYFRLNAKNQEKDAFLYEELPFFKPHPGGSFYMVDPKEARGINCRFGMRGNTAENHFDSSRNFIALFGGERRYILSHPDQCLNLALYPKGHPSSRHSAVDWANPDLGTYPEFANAKVNEVVMQAGDVLYLPTNWFHHIVSLNTNFQCNARSGTTRNYHKHIRHCGFNVKTG